MSQNRIKDDLAGASEGSLAQANVHFLLARLWSHELDLEALNELASGGLSSAYVEAGGWLPEEMSVAQEFVESLAIEFCQCFLGPKGHLPPHQSVVVDSRFQSDCLDSLKEFSELIGAVECSSIVSQPMPDHASELLAMQGQVFLSLHRAQLSGDESGCNETSEVLGAFRQQHLSWLVDYCKVAHERTESNFYRGLFRVTEQLLDPVSDA